MLPVVTYADVQRDRLSNYPKWTASLATSPDTYLLTSIWRPSAFLNLQYFDTLSHVRPYNQNLQRHTKFHWKRMIRGWDIAKKPFSKWRPSAILNFQNLVFWSRDLCLNAILLFHTKFRVNRTINRWDIAKRRFAIWRPSAILDLLWRHHIASENTIWRS